MKEVKKFFSSLNGPAEDDAVIKFGEAVLNFINDINFTDKKMQNAIDRLLEAKPSPTKQKLMKV